MKNLINIFLCVLIIIGCGEDIESPDNTEYHAKFYVVEGDTTVFVGDTVFLSAVLEDNPSKSNEELPDYSIVWQLITGGGSLSGIKGKETIYFAPDSIPPAFEQIQAMISVFPKMDMRYEEIITVTIKNRFELDTGICFTRDILPIFNSNCALAECHDSETKEDGFDLSNYEGIIKKDFKPGNPEDSEIFETIVGKDGYDDDDRMPPPPRNLLSAEQIDLIYRWIKEGGKNEKCSNQPRFGCDSANVTFSGSIMPIIQYNCIGCHSTADPQGDINLETYAKVKELADDGSLYGSITHHPDYVPMPREDITMPECYLRLISIWIDDGAPNN